MRLLVRANENEHPTTEQTEVVISVFISLSIQEGGAEFLFPGHPSLYF